MEQNKNLVELTEDLHRNGKVYPKGTKGELIGLLSLDITKPMCLGMQIDYESVIITDDVQNCTDFKYKQISSE
jgi:hypothetical protein